jgi:hypothetical protein
MGAKRRRRSAAAPVADAQARSASQPLNTPTDNLCYVTTVAMLICHTEALYTWTIRALKSLCALQVRSWHTSDSVAHQASNLVTATVRAKCVYGVKSGRQEAEGVYWLTHHVPRDSRAASEAELVGTAGLCPGMRLD